ncbi:MAG: DUF4382 domain-containing protein [Acidobacteriaceae bacterium]
MRHTIFLRAVAACAVAAGLAGCGSNGSPSSSMPSNAQSAPVFLTGTDAPLPSVVSFQVAVDSVTLSNGGNNGVDILQSAQTVDFARYNGLQTLLDFNSVPAGTYNTVTVSLSNPVISYVNLSSATPPAPPTVATVNNATLTNSTVTVQLSTPFTVTAGQAAGLKMDFDLRQSILTDSNGNVTGQVNPTIDFTALTPNTPSSEIDEFYATVISVNTSQNTFMIQGPHGHQYTVALDQANSGSGTTPTEWDDTGDENGNSQGTNDGTVNLANLVPNQTIVDLAGQFQPSTQTFYATDVAIVSQDGFYAGGTVSYVTPATGTATAFQMYVRSLLPTDTGVQLGQLATVQLTGNETFFVFRRHLPLLQFLFNSSLIVPGQNVSIGGPASGAQNANSVAAKRIVLHLAGFSGTVVPGSVSQSGNSFQFVPNGLNGYLLGNGNPSANPVRVYLVGKSEFRDGFTGVTDLDSLSSTAVVRIVGLVLKDPATGQPVIIGRYIDKTSDTAQ